MPRYVGAGKTVNHTPNAAVAAGDVVLLGDLVGIANVDIPANELGALQIEGEFEFPKPTGSNTGSTAGQLQYWDATAKQAVETDASGANKRLGRATAATTDAATTVLVKINI